MTGKLKTIAECKPGKLYSLEVKDAPMRVWQTLDTGPNTPHVDVHQGDYFLVVERRTRDEDWSASGMRWIDMCLLVKDFVGYVQYLEAWAAGIFVKELT